MAEREIMGDPAAPSGSRAVGVEPPSGVSPVPASIPIAEQRCVAPAILESLRCVGYAPGSYFVRCEDCGGLHVADKRASCCIGCADKRAMRWIAQGIEASGRDAASRLDAKHESPTPRSGDAP